MIADVEAFGGVVDAAPRHIGDMEKAVDTAEVDESAVVGDIFDLSVEDLAFLEFVEGVLFEGFAFFFEEGATRKDDIGAFFVELDDFEFVALSDQFVEVTNRAEVDLGAGEEGFDADIDGEAAFDTLNDDTFDDLVFFAGFGDLFPDLELVSFFFGDTAMAVVVFEDFDEDIDLIAGFDRERFAVVAEFAKRDLAFGFEADIDKNFVFFDFDDGAAYDSAFLDHGFAFFLLFQEGGKVLFVVKRRVVFNEIGRAHV